jgi:GNAT superfamily N-acetyltransferase
VHFHVSQLYARIKHVSPAANCLESVPKIKRFCPPVSRERIDGYLKHSFPNGTTIVVDSEGRIAGFGSICRIHGELRAVYVSAEFGRLGVGLALLREIERLAKERGCKELA